jgi:hypothetical protein
MNQNDLDFLVQETLDFQSAASIPDNPFKLDGSCHEESYQNLEHPIYVNCKRQAEYFTLSCSKEKNELEIDFGIECPGPAIANFLYQQFHRMRIPDFSTRSIDPTDRDRFWFLEVKEYELLLHRGNRSKDKVTDLITLGPVFDFNVGVHYFKLAAENKLGPFNFKSVDFTGNTCRLLFEDQLSRKKCEHWLQRSDPADIPPKFTDTELSIEQYSFDLFCLEYSWGKFFWQNIQTKVQQMLQ